MIRQYVVDRGARLYIDGVQFNENKLTYIRKEEHAKLIIFYFTKYTFNLNNNKQQIYWNSTLKLMK